MGLFDMGSQAPANGLQGGTRAIGDNSQINPNIFSFNGGTDQNNYSTNYQNNYSTPMMQPPNISALDQNSPFLQAAQANAFGNQRNAQAATSANRVNQNTQYGNLNYQQSGVDQYGNPTYTANQTLAPQFQGAFNNLANNVTNASGTPLDTGMASWDKATGLINQRLQPQIERENQASDAQLANQGIMPGSQAYNTAKTLLSQQHNDLSNQAQLAGLQAQNQFFNQNVTASNLPYQQLGAFKSATTPNYINAPTQATVAGPDYLGAYTAQNATNIAQQNADRAAQQNNISGLYGLGSGLLAGGTGANSALGTIGSGLSGLYNYAKNNYGASNINNPFYNSTDFMNAIGANSSGALSNVLPGDLAFQQSIGIV